MIKDKKPHTAKQISEGAGISPRSVFRVVARLREEGHRIDSSTGSGGGLRWVHGPEKYSKSQREGTNTRASLQATREYFTAKPRTAIPTCSAADVLGVSECTVRNHVNKLREAGMDIRGTQLGLVYLPGPA